MQELQEMEFGKKFAFLKTYQSGRQLGEIG
jgi:hypothetical protein